MLKFIVQTFLHQYTVRFIYKKIFPSMFSYNRFIELSHPHALEFMLFIHYACKREFIGISFIDSTVLRVCHSKRKNRNKVFKGITKVGKSTIG